MTALRSSLFLLGAIVVTPVFGLLVTIAGLFHFPTAFRFAAAWAAWMLKWAEWTCGIRCRVRGWENVPGHPVVIMAKHQSAWETLFIASRFPPQCWIIKKELLWLPFVGWGLWGIRSIAIDRSSGKTAREQIVEQGRRRLADGLWVAIFPEGTRVAPGKSGRYGIGGALLATRTATPILPMAHNAGEFWPRYAFRKHPGVVDVVIGPLIRTEGRDVVSVHSEVETWIEAQMRAISPERYAHA